MNSPNEVVLGLGVYLISSIDLVSSKSEPMSWEGLRGDFFVSSKRYMMFYLEELGPNSIQWDAIESATSVKRPAYVPGPPHLKMRQLQMFSRTSIATS